MSFRGRRRERIAAMRERIDVETATTDESSGQPIRTWSTTLSGEPAQWTPTAGTESIRGRQVEAGIAAIFTVHHRDNVYTVEQRIAHNSQYYGIVYIKPVEGGRRYIELHCKAVP
ncbi:MAG: phage head closure protein [Planctomycetales bacterium]|nr:phage head closure protein [Planctomycetales bacterium]